MAEIKMERRGLSELREYENNARRNDKAVGALMESLERFGYVNPIIINKSGVILAGHTRVKALRKKGVLDVDCVIVDGLSNEQEKAFRIADNRAAEFSSWDEDKLEEEMRALGSIDWEALGFNRKEIGRLDEPGVCRCPKCGRSFFEE